MYLTSLPKSYQSKALTRYTSTIETMEHVPLSVCVCASSLLSSIISSAMQYIHLYRQLQIYNCFSQSYILDSFSKVLFQKGLPAQESFKNNKYKLSAGRLILRFLVHGIRNSKNLPCLSKRFILKQQNRSLPIDSAPSVSCLVDKRNV